MEESATHRVPRRDRLRVSPALDPGEVSFLAGFGPAPVPDHRDRLPGGASAHGSRAPAPVRRIWPGQPAVPCPWVPCAEGCCLHVAATALPGVAAQWLRFWLAEFLEPRHAVSGCVEVSSAAGRIRSVLMVERGEVFEGDLDEPAGC